MEETNSLNKNATFTDKVMVGLNKALRKMAEEAAFKGESLVIGDKDGNVKSVLAEDLLKTLPK